MWKTSRSGLNSRARSWGDADFHFITFLLCFHLTFAMTISVQVRPAVIESWGASIFLGFVFLIIGAWYSTVIRDGSFTRVYWRGEIEARRASALSRSAHKLACLHIRYLRTCVPEVALGARPIRARFANTPSQEWREVGLFSLLPHLPMSLDETFELRKELLDGVHVR